MFEKFRKAYLGFLLCLSLLGLITSTHTVYIFTFLQVVKIKAISNHYKANIRISQMHAERNANVKTNPKRAVLQNCASHTFLFD